MLQCYNVHTLPILLKYKMHQVIDKGSHFIKHEGNQPHIVKDRAFQSWAEHDLCNSRTVVEAGMSATLSHPYSLETVMKWNSGMKMGAHRRLKSGTSRFMALTLYNRGIHIFQKCRSKLKRLGAGRVTWITFHSEDPKVLHVTVQNAVSQVTWYMWLVHSCCIVTVSFQS